MSAAANPRPSAIPPAATTGMPAPIASTTSGTSATSPRDTPCPPASPPLGDKNVRAGRGGLSGKSGGLNLTDKDRAGALDPIDERSRVAEGKHDCRRLAFERQVQQFRLLRHAPGNEADAKSGLRLDEQTEFAGEPVFIAVPATQNAEPAGSSYRRGQPRIGHQIHRREQDRVRDSEELR
jgi:hypothetical protein